jgi:hypothetical protein
MPNSRLVLDPHFTPFGHPFHEYPAGLVGAVTQEFQVKLWPIGRQSFSFLAPSAPQTFNLGYQHLSQRCGSRILTNPPYPDAGT